MCSLCIQEPVEIQVGSSQYVTQLSGAKRKKVLTRDTFCYIPILSTLKQILQVQCVHDEILKPVQKDDDLLHDFSDGALFKQHAFFKTHPQSLQIVAYYDEVETCNPLGSSSGKNKLGCVFFTLGNIRPSYRSSLKSIFLVAVAKSSTIEKNGIDFILKPFLDDLKTLHEVGVTINVSGSIEVWKGALLAFLADNLAAHELGGFKESFSFALRFCRSCLTDKECSQKHFREDQFTIRDRISHGQQCCRLNSPDRLSVSVEFGINRCSSLESLSYFSVVECMPHDIMHDLFEGVIPYELQLLICHCKLKSYFSLDTLNYRLNAYDFGYSEVGDKPALIHDSNIRQTASQMWLLAKIFPILVGDLVPRDDPNWHCFLTLLKICEICVAPALSADTVAYLEVLIEEHHQHFTKLYPDKSITPKMHFMVHYPRQILNYGPLINAWTMRHEAKLRIIKRAARVSNYKNVCQSVAKRHQHLLSFYIHSNRLLGKGIETGPCKELSFAAFPRNIQSLLTTKYQLTNESRVYSSPFVTYSGITLKPNAYVLWQYDTLTPSFCKISTIIKTDCEDVILVMSQYETEYYDTHYRAYCIHQCTCPATSYHVCNVKELHHYSILHPRRSFAKDEKLYLMLKCHFETSA